MDECGGSSAWAFLVFAGSWSHMIPPGDAEAGASDSAVALQWKMNALDEMMQCVTAAEQRMLDISSMRVA